MFKILLWAIWFTGYATAISSAWSIHYLKKSKRETNKNGCVLPSHPINGKYTIQSGSVYQVNKIVSDSTLITLDCNQGYITADTNIFFCNQTHWEPTLDKVYCIRACPALHSSDTYNVRCLYRNKPRNCNIPIQGTIAKIKCKRFHVKHSWKRPTCRDGYWDPAVQPCNPECGQKKDNMQTLVIGSTNAERSEYPWMVGLYNSSRDHICGGSIISRFYILTAAHCFYDENGVLLDKSKFILVAGKYYRDLNIQEEGVQIRNIIERRIHEDYRGAITKYRDDIAVIKVEKLDVTQQVQLVCIDWSNAYEDRDLVENNKGVVSGWGYTTEIDNPSKVLKKLIVPYRSTNSCKQFMDPDFFDQYYTSDKFCAGFNNEETSVCVGDSGGGLSFLSKPTTYYVRGIVSLAPRSEVGCDSNQFALYTKVSSYLDWLQRITQIITTNGFFYSNNGCVLPSHPINGKYKMIMPRGDYQVNSVVTDSTFIKLKCNENYTNSNANFFMCNHNHWKPTLENGYCIRTCPALHSTDTYEVSCSYQNALRNCSVAIEGTTADIKCKPYYSKQIWEIPICQDGYWDPVPQPCYPECGQKIVDVQTLVIGGTNAEPGEYPWVLGIYRAASKQHICGASMISRLFVLSAAHCFYDENDNGILLDKSQFIIAAGKYYRDLNIEEKGVQIRKIKELRIHEDYKGAITKYRDDIAVIEVEKLDVTPQVQPVCIDWADNYEDRDFVENNKAVVPGWGYTIEGGNSFEVLKKLIVPYRSKDVCEKYMDPDFFNHYYSSDKICAGYKDEGTSVCSGDSGGGLFFRSEPTTFYVRAIVSLAPRSEVGCNSNHFALYTKVSKYLDWLTRITRRRI